MRSSTLFSSLAYALLQITQGLLIHPYQTTQSLVREKVFSWMVWLPTITVGSIYAVWKIVIVPVVQLIFSCQDSVWQICRVLPPLSNWLIFFCIYWQILLLYLWVRFWLAMRSDQHAA